MTMIPREPPTAFPLLSIVEIDGRQGVVRGRILPIAGREARYDVLIGHEILSHVEAHRLTFIRPPTDEELGAVVAVLGVAA
jgi:hypothetical protein